MKVELVIDGARHTGEPLGERVRIEGATCPCCSDLDAVVDASGRVMALAASTTGMAKALRDNPGCKAQSSEAAGPLHVYSDEKIERERTYEGRALCCRCRRPLSAAEHLESASELCKKAAEAMRLAAEASFVGAMQSKPGTVIWVMCNPSDADGEHDDMTIAKCRGFCERWGYSSMIIHNRYTLVATHASDLGAAITAGYPTPTTRNGSSPIWSAPRWSCALPR